MLFRSFYVLKCPILVPVTIITLSIFSMCIPNEMVVSQLCLCKNSSKSPLIYPSQTGNFTFYSTYVEDNFTIYIRLPQNYNGSDDQRYQSVYVLDGDWYFDGSYPRGQFIDPYGMVGLLSDLTSSRKIPGVILVAIGYPDQNYRGRDFLFEPQTFYRFLKEELIPYVDAQYKTIQSQRTLIGQSDGGYFTVFALFQYREDQNTVFRNFIALSGNYDKDYAEGSESRTLNFIFSEELELYNYLKGQEKLETQLFMGVGALEPERFHTGYSNLVTILNTRRYSDFKFMNKTYDGLDHGTILASIREALIWIYDDSSEKPIRIDVKNNISDFSSFSDVIAGDGTKISPYLIKDLVFNIQYYFTAGLEIKNSQKYVQIQNCSFFNGKLRENDGIYLDNCTNIEISDCNFTNNYNGINLVNSNAITLSGNIMVNTGLGILNSMNNTVSSNLVNNKQLHYYENIQGQALDNAEIGQLILVKCQNFTITNNNIYSTSSAIVLSYSSNVMVSDNCLSLNVHGLYLEHSFNTTLKDNNVSCNLECGLYLDNSSNNFVLRNILDFGEISCGIRLESSSNNVFSGNHMHLSGFMIYNSQNNSIDDTNLVNDLPIYYFENKTNLILSNLTDIGQLILVKCNNSFVANLNLERSVSGLLLINSTYNNISNNNFRFNLYGLYLDRSNYNIIESNVLSHNKMYGLYLRESSKNRIFHNHFYTNSFEDISGTAGYYNYIYDNVFSVPTTPTESSQHNTSSSMTSSISQASNYPLGILGLVAISLIFLVFKRKKD
ncbi:MAG: NosD domain-containing protein [Candidatus Hermodarchaeota archaeon]